MAKTNAKRQVSSSQQNSHKKAQLNDAAQAVDQHTQSILETLTDSVICVDGQWRYTYVNRQAEILLGRMREELLGRVIWDVFPLCPGSLFHQKMYEAMDSHIGLEYTEFNHLLKKWLEVRIHPASTGLSVFFRDATERKQIEQQLQESEQQLQMALETAKLGTWQSDLATGRIDCTKICKMNIGIPPETALTYDMLLNAILPSDREQVLQARKRALKEGVPYQVEYRVQWPDESIHWIAASGRVVYGEDGKPVRMVGMTLDITDRKELDLRKDEFISMASHELKTPITTLKGYTQLLKRRFEKEGVQEPVEMLGKIETQINRLTKLIDDLLDVSKIQAGRLAYTRELIDIDALVHEIVEVIQQTSPTHAIAVHGASHKLVPGDSERLRQLFDNLVSNAVKYSPRADTVDIHLAATQDTVIVSIRDYGVGIPQQHQSKIFDRFYRVPDIQDKTFPGLGMGLYICDEIAKRHGGEITVVSEEGNGSTFSVSLPFQK